MSIDTDSPSSSQYLSSSHSSLNNGKKLSSEISKAYKHASQLYLTRRLSEAYQALQPIITTPKPAHVGSADEDEDHSLAPIATASTSQRIKIWSLYVSLLNAVVDLGHEEGTIEFGHKEYKDLVKQVQSGDVWEQVVRDGYQGRESSVDAEVVYNLSTLLLGQAATQNLNQSRLETYLSSSSTLQPQVDIASHLNSSLSGSRSPRRNGTDTPKDLTSRIKLLELFTLHVLPRNEEWDFARSFIANSDTLDEERREAFLQTLQELQEVKEQEENFVETEDELDTEVESETTPPSANDTDRKAGGERHGAVHKRTSSEVDYGIERAHPNGVQDHGKRNTTTITRPTANGHTTSKATLTTLPPAPEPELSGLSPSSSSTPHPSHRHHQQHQHHLSPPSQTPRRPARRPKASSSVTQNTLIAQARHLFTALSNLVRNMTGSLSANPTAMFRFLLFLVALLMALSRPEIRDRVRRVMGKSWDKIRQTIGMGVKVSYI